MSDQYTILNPGTGGDAIDEEAVTYGGAPTTRVRQRVVIGGDQAAALAKVQNSAPASTDYGITTRNIPSGTQNVSTNDPAGVASPVVSDDSIVLLRRIVKLLESSAVVDSSNRQRVTIDAGTLPAVTTVAAVTSVNAFNNVDSRFLMIEQARQSYAVNIRANLKWA